MNYTDTILENTREARWPEDPFVCFMWMCRNSKENNANYSKQQDDLNRWCIICLSSTQSTTCIFPNGFLNFTSSIHAKIMHIYMFWSASGQIVQMMMHHLHDRVCIFCFLGILTKNGTYTQCKTTKPVSKHASFVTDRHTHEHHQIWGSPTQKALRAMMSISPWRLWKFRSRTRYPFFSKCSQASVSP